MAACSPPLPSERRWPKSDLTIEFGRNLFMERRRACLSQEALAQRTGLHRTAIGLLESGRREPRLSTLLKLSEALEVEPQRLLEGLRVETRDNPP
jgi:transcriptional regulator with XRE-family HTH domain